MSNIIRLNETAPGDQWIVMSNQGTAGFDLNEMPWQDDEVNKEIVIPWLKQFAKLIRQMTSIPPIHTNLSD